ncbi:MAG: transmembrane anchor protein [Hydrogenophaga sp.]|nr:transmembrane anchor protein [Hydrogenophaga sp.]
MYNSETPVRAELPSSRQLLRSTVIAAITAVVLLTTVVLPADYGIDPTGVGRVLGLTEMGEIKTRLAAEAKADAAATSAAAPATAPAAAAVPMASANPQSSPAAPAPGPVAQAPAPTAAPVTTQAGVTWRDEMSFTLAPGVGTEVKLKMKEGEKALYAWAVEGGVVNYDTHGDGSGRSISYVKGRAVPADQGELVAAFTGNHGWFWRNRGQADVKVTLRTGGTYSDIQHVK